MNYNIIFHSIENKDHSDHDWLLCKCSDKQNDPQCRETGHELDASIPRLFHAESQSSRLFIVAGQSPSFWWETRRSNCRNDPVKYDLDWWPIRVALNGHRTTFLFECQCSFSFCLPLVAVYTKYMVDSGYCEEMTLYQSSYVAFLFEPRVAWSTWRRAHSGAKSSDITGDCCPILYSNSIPFQYQSIKGVVAQR